MSDSAEQALVDALLIGDQSASISEAKRLHASGVSVEKIVTGAIGKALDQLDGKCTLDQFNLLEIMLVGRAVMGVVRELVPQGGPEVGSRGRVVVASLEGDVHDLGKNILRMVLTGRGYQVFDCGKDCPLERLVGEAVQRGADAVCISGLITTVVPKVKKVRELLDRRGSRHIRVLAGGAALKQGTADNLNVDFVADTAFDGVRYLESTLDRTAGA